MRDLTDVIDLESGVEIASIFSSYGYHKGRDIFVTASKEEGKDYQIGYYKRYSTGELIDKAREILQNTELTDETKSRYGIQ